MLKMLKSVIIDLPILQSDDPYIPLSISLFDEPVGSIYHRIRNFSTSLLEIPVHPMTGIILGFTIVSFDKIIPNLFADELPPEEGIPVVDINEAAINNKSDIYISIRHQDLLVTWDILNNPDKKLTYRSMEFYLSNDVVIGILAKGIGYQRTVDIAAGTKLY